MKLARIGAPGAERPVVLLGETIDPSALYIDVSDVVGDYDGDFFARGGPALIEGAVAERRAAGQTQALGEQRLGAPIARPHQILCVGLNYVAHADESKMATPDEPILFSKAPNSISGPFDPVRMPRGAAKLDYEVELAVVIGRQCAYLADAAAAAEVIAGFTIANDVSERAFQLERNGQWFKGKSALTFNPCGPFVATPDEVPCSQLDIWLDVNGQRRQSSSTSKMIFDVYEIVRYMSQFMQLEPGDLINTGTPSGVGLGMQPPSYLQVGDEMRLGVSGLGEQRYTVAPAGD